MSTAKPERSSRNNDRRRHRRIKHRLAHDRGGRLDTAQRFEQLLAAGKDGALLRFALGHEYLNGGNAAAAIPHLRRAVDFDPGYSAAWKLLGKALTAENQIDDAVLAYERGIAAAAAKGDKQAQKEMQVFARRLAKGRTPE